MWSSWVGMLAVGATFLSVLPVGAAAEDRRDGRLRAVVREDFVSGEETVTYTLHDGDETLRVLPTEPVEAGTGDAVEVAGEMRAGRLVGEVEALSSSEPAPGANEPRKAVVLLANFKGSELTPVSAEDVRDRVFTGPTSANAFYTEETWGKVSLAGKERADGDIYGWYTIDHPTDACSYGEWARLTREMAEEDGVSLEGYHHVLYLFANPLDPTRACGPGARAEAGGRNSWYFSSENDVYDYASWMFTHELGHNLGFAHANALVCHDDEERQVPMSADCLSTEYGDPFDNMGVGFYRHHNGWFLQGLGSLGPENVETVEESGTYSLQSALEPTDQPTALRIVRVPGFSWYDLEIREAGSFFEAAPATTTGVSVRLTGQVGVFAPSNLINTSPPNLQTAPLAPGETFFDPVSRVRITTVSAGGGMASVLVGLDDSPDEVPPAAPTDLTGSDSAAGVQLSWNASVDSSPIIRYVLFRDGEEIGTSSETSFTDSDPPVGAHAYVVYGEDVAGNRSEASEPAIVWASDFHPPDWPANLAATANGDGVELTWLPSFDNVGTERYVVFRDGEEIGTSSETNFTDVDPPVGSRTYTVRAEDAVGNRSEASAPRMVNVSDLRPPSRPTNLVAAAAGRSVDLAWDPSADNVGVVSYAIFRNGVEIGASQATTFLDDDLPSGDYSYVVQAEDAAGNRSQGSAPSLVSLPIADDAALPAVLTPSSVGLAPPSLGEADPRCQETERVRRLAQQVLRLRRLMRTARDARSRQERAALSAARKRLRTARRQAARAC